MELAKAVLYVSLLATMFFVFAWWSTSRADVRAGMEQAVLNDICSLLESPANTTLARRYYIDFSVTIEDKTLISTIALAPQCASMNYNGSHYVYSLPLRAPQPYVLRGSVRLIIVRKGDGVWVSKG